MLRRASTLAKTCMQVSQMKRNHDYHQKSHCFRNIESDRACLGDLTRQNEFPSERKSRNAINVVKIMKFAVAKQAYKIL